MTPELLNKLKYLAQIAAHLPSDVTLEDEDSAMKALHDELAADTVLELIALAEHSLSAQDEVLTLHADKLLGLMVSMDVSTCDADAANRIFGKVIATMPSEDGIVILAEEESRNCDAAAPSPAVAVEPVADTGNAHADRIINRLMSSDPDFEDCTQAAALIRRLVAENKGPDGFETWRDAAVDERLKRVSAGQCCSHGIHFDNACGACIPPRGTTVHATPSPSLAVRDVVDAARYRWLKSKGGIDERDGGYHKSYWLPRITKEGGTADKPIYHHDLDAAIDAAMREQL